MSHHRTVIVGTGFSGLGMAVRLLKDGERDFVLLERAGEIGGTWRDNTYPGCRCDVPSHLYSFSFAPNPNWSSTFSPSPRYSSTSTVWPGGSAFSSTCASTARCRAPTGTRRARCGASALRRGP